MEIPPIVPNNPISHTCAVCGTPVGGLLTGLPSLSGLGPKKCSSCHKTSCSKHFAGGKDVCSNCEKKDWCGTPKGPAV